MASSANRPTALPPYRPTAGTTALPTNFRGEFDAAGPDHPVSDPPLDLPDGIRWVPVCLRWTLARIIHEIDGDFPNVVVE
jgi:hypothetical protein